MSVAQAWTTAAAFGLDLALGDPRWALHPVRALGTFIAWSERRWRAFGRIAGLRAAGVLLWGFVLTVAGGFVAATLELAPEGWPRRALEAYWIYSFLAVRDLDVEASAAVAPLMRGDLAQARRMTARIVGRDTHALDEEGVVRAAIETTAESLSDGIVGPLFWLALGGPVAMALYKAANTLDSMVGYRNERYLELGWCSARIDDLLNYVPARLTALLISATAALVGLSARGAWDAVRADAAKQPSPNSGYPEAAMAGAIGVQLGGLSFYSGTPSDKPTLGLPLHPLTLESFARARRSLYATSAVGALLAATARLG